MNKNDMQLKIMEQESQIQVLNTMYDNLRGFRHDFSNLVQALYGYVQLNDMNGIKKVIHSVMEDWNYMNHYELLYLNDIENPAICGILSSKYVKTKEYGIRMKIEIGTPLNDLEDELCDVCRILSILIDNAIEAAYLTKEKKVNIKILKGNSEEKRIIVENSYSNPALDIHQIFEKGYSSKKENTMEHGIGLWNVKKILNHHENMELMTRKGEFFSQELVIYGRLGK